jgi:hypothetical protein
MCQVGTVSAPWLYWIMQIELAGGGRDPSRHERAASWLGRDPNIWHRARLLWSIPRKALVVIPPHAVTDLRWSHRGRLYRCGGRAAPDSARRHIDGARAAGRRTHQRLPGAAERDIVSNNVKRGHLNSGQRAMAMAMIYPAPSRNRQVGSPTTGLADDGALSKARTVLRLPRSRR